MARHADARLRPMIAAARGLLGPFAAVAMVALATATHALLMQFVPRLPVFSLYYPAILAAALVGGEIAAVIAVTLSTVLGWGVLYATLGARLSADVHVDVLLFALTGAFIGAVGAALRRVLLRRRAVFLQLADREARYRALFDGVAEGVALLKAVREDGKVVDFVIAEANAAVLEMFHLTSKIVGQRQSTYREPFAPEYLAAGRRALDGVPVRMELYSPPAGRWFEIRMTRVDDDLIAQIFVDITEHKAAERHKTEMFNELNHRVKNNLAAVSAMLSMQARAADDPRVRDQLAKAVDRIESIGEVHASLYRASSTGDVDFSGYLQRLCARLSTSLLDSDRVRVEVDADAVTAPLEEAVALGLIVNELITNAAKHAYPAPMHGVIEVVLRRDPSELVLQVSDHGRGLSANDSSGGIGMRLVRSLVQQCQGRLEIGGEDGASFTVRVPKHAEPAAA